MQIQTVQRLVEQQQPGPAGERLGDQQPLLLPAGQPPDRLVGVAGGADQLDQLGDPPLGCPAATSPGQGQAPPVAVQTESDHVQPADPDRRVEAATLRQVPDLGPGLPGRSAQHHRPSRGQRQQPERRLEQGGLAHTVGAEDRDELPGGRLDVDPAPDHPPVEPDRGVPEHHRRRGRRGRPVGASGHDGVDGQLPGSCTHCHERSCYFPVARASALRRLSSWATCQSWKDAPAGVSVSVMVVTGIPAAFASST